MLLPDPSGLPFSMVDSSIPERLTGRYTSFPSNQRVGKILQTYASGDIYKVIVVVALNAEFLNESLAISAFLT
jgi:hypothetical protein